MEGGREGGREGGIDRGRERRSKGNILYITQTHYMEEGGGGGVAQDILCSSWHLTLCSPGYFKQLEDFAVEDTEEGEGHQRVYNEDCCKGDRHLVSPNYVGTLWRVSDSDVAMETSNTLNNKTKKKTLLLHCPGEEADY